ncbi:MAG: acetate--CoA ligase family protein [Thermofilum sp.]|jgi:acetyl-CoA synthetase (ADP-forming)|nr:acetate--CoA ligase family protein [Thermofilum sp.]
MWENDPAGNAEEALSVIWRAKEEGRKKLLEHEAFKVCESFGLPVPKHALVVSPDEAVESARMIGYPVVLKVVSPDIVHKSDVGGVILNVRSDAEVSEGFSRIMGNVRARAPKCRVVGVLVQEMAPPALEVVVGAIRDKTFGPAVMFGLGGVFVEAVRDVTFRVSPVTPVDAEAMIREIKAHRILEGFRGSAPRDVEALKEIIVKVSNLMEKVEEVSELDLNPIMLYERGSGAKIVDARIIVG